MIPTTIMALLPGFKTNCSSGLLQSSKSDAFHKIRTFSCFLDANANKNRTCVEINPRACAVWLRGDCRIDVKGLIGGCKFALM